MSVSALAACMAPLLLRPLLAGDCEFEDDFNMGGDGSIQLLKAAAAANHAQAIIIILLEKYDIIFDVSSFDHDELISVIQEDLLHEGSMSSELYSDSGDGDVEDDDSTDNDMLDDDECHDEHNGSDDSTDNDIPDDDGYHDEHNGVEADIDDDSEHSSSETIGESNSNVGSNPCDDKVPIPILSQILLSNHCVTRYLSHQVTWLVYPVINSWLSIVYPDQGFPYRSVPPVPGGTYQSFRLPVRGPPATGRYHQNRPLTVDFGHRQSIEGEIDRRRLIEGEKRKKKKKRKRRKKKRRRRIARAVLARTPSLAMGRP
ncbi:hypothetical protein GW17_00020468 [Ensete ventricosum]|nr:hypothetical protein GW17_00020468 [Ensete ventricosum]